jgi:hypothetical protein
VKVAVLGLLAVVSILLGIAGTLTVQALTDDGQSADCELATYGASEQFNQLNESGAVTDEELRRLDLILDITYKLCHP